MNRIALVNTRSIESYPKLLKSLNENIGKVEYVKIESDVSGKELSGVLMHYSYIVCGTYPIFDSEFFDLSIKLKHIARFGIGVDNIDIDSAAKNGIVVTNIPGYVEKEDVAEHTVGLLLSLTKKIIESNAAVKNYEWNKSRKRFLGTRINGKTVGIIGFGNIGRSFGRIMKYGFGCNLLVYDPYLDESVILANGAMKSGLNELLEQCDIVSLHINLTSETRNIINSEKLKYFKKGAILLNAARGGLIDELAVCEELKQSNLGGYGCDVLEKEPVDENNPLLNLDNVVITPHIAAYDIECNFEMCETVVNDMILIHKGKKPKHVIRK